MTSTRLGVFLISLVTFVPTDNAIAQVEIFQHPAPASHERAQTSQLAPTVESLTRSGGAVLVPLDSTGIADWRYMNPRRPARVAPGVAIEFENQTADRTFEVTTTLALKPGDIASSELPATAPLVVYDAMTPGPNPTPAELAAAWNLNVNDVRRMRIEEIENRLLTEAKAAHPSFARILESVRTLELELRVRAEKRTGEATARTNAGKLTSNATVAEIEGAAAAVQNAERARQLADDAVTRHTGAGTDTAKDDLEEQRNALIDHLEQRMKLVEPDDADRADKIALFTIAIDALKNQSDETAFLAPFRRSLPGMRLEDCTVGATATCTATIRIRPSGRESFPHRVLEVQPDGAALAKFNVRFFEEEEAPARQTAYLISANRVASITPPKTAATLLAVASVGVSLDPYIEDRSASSRNCPFLCPDKPYIGARRTHYPGSGRVEFTQTFGNLLDGKVAFTYKEGDLGGTPATVDVKLSQYRFNIYSEPGVTFHFGRFPFAAPSSGIAINETGEGYRLAFRNVAASQITKRESLTNTPDPANRDNESRILEANNISISDPFPRLLPAALAQALRARWQPFRTLSLIYLDGNDRKSPEKKKHPTTGVEETFFAEHSYRTIGGQVGYAVRPWFYGNLAVYHSQRDAEESDAPCRNALHVCDGKGWVGLGTLTYPFSRDETGRAKRTVTLTYATGTGDNPATPVTDEGFIGETAGFAPDLIFLSTMATGLSTREYLDATLFIDKNDAGRDAALKSDFHARELGVSGLGRGLSNKHYAGVKFVDNSVSLLAWLARNLPFLRVPESDIRARATLLTYNQYKLRYPLFDSRNAGREVDLEFQAETPRAVKVSLKLGYFWAGAAVRPIIKKNAWTAAGSISISL